MNAFLKKFAVVSLVSGFVLLANIPTQAVAIPFFSSNTEIPSLAPMLEETMPAVVSISVEGKQVSRQAIPEMFRPFFGGQGGQVQERPFRSLGSGVIVDADKGYIVTNAHVVDSADKIVVTLTDGREFEATKVGTDNESDIALLEIEPDKLTEITLADSDKLRVGDFVIAIGNPFGLSQTVTSGIVSALGRTGVNVGGYENFIQTDAAINRGNSGGALINLKGELVGINAAIFAPGANAGNVGIGFAIPSNMMNNLIKQMIEFGEVRRGLLGVIGNDVDAGLAEAFNSEVNKGAFVAEVTEDSAAAKAGIQAGDIISKVNGKLINSFAELRAKIASMGAGAKVELGIIRQGEALAVNVVLGDAGFQAVTAAEIHPAFEGATFENGTDLAGNRGIT
ncbi:MAG: Do family serine endopeptidase, partial [Glaciecola sp.]